MYCKKCGKQIEDNSKFCDYCGASTADESNQVQSGQVQGESPRQHYPPQQSYAQQQPGPVQQQGYVQQQPGYVQQPGYPPPANTGGGVTDFILGIISIVLSVIIFIQSYLVGFSEAIFSSDSGSGTAGKAVSIFVFIAGIIVLIAGIVGLVIRKNDGKGRAITVDVPSIFAALSGKGGAITASVLYILAALIGFAGAGNFTDLNIYAVVLLIFGAVFIVLAVKRN
jgi:hypothetical protein